MEKDQKIKALESKITKCRQDLAFLNDLIDRTEEDDNFSAEAKPISIKDNMLKSLNETSCSNILKTLYPNIYYNSASLMIKSSTDGVFSSRYVSA